MLLGTLDSYFAKLVNNFPLEVGLEPGKASTVPEYEEDDHRKQVISEIMDSIEKDVELNGYFLELINEFKGDESASSPLAIFDKAVDSYLKYFALCPEDHRWGAPEAIWGHATPEWIDEEYFDKHHPTAWMAVSEWTHKNFEKTPAPLRDLALAVQQEESPDHDLALGCLCDFFADFLNNGNTNRKFGINQYDLTEIAPHITTLHRCYGGRHILGRMRSTRGLFRLLKIYRAKYDEIALRTGRLTFADYVSLLQAKFMPGERREEVTSWIDQVHFRLDCQIQHWMLDEFQDTSTTQYAVLSRNILEILGQKFNGRSVFVVGDLKQSLYEWREGNRRLLTQVEHSFHRQNQEDPGAALTDELTKTWRCAPPVLAMVNAELGNLTKADVGDTFPAEALKDWTEVFKTQEAMNLKKKGEAVWVEIRTGEGAIEKAVGIRAQAIWIANHLRNSPGLIENGRLGLGLSCAILVGKNEDAEEFAEELRNLGIRATDESKSLVTQDNPVTIGLIGILQHTIHPDNLKARALAEMCPPVLMALHSFTPNKNSKEAWNKVSAHVAGTFSSRGARAIVDDLIRRTSLDEKIDLSQNGDLFVAQRLNQLRVMSTDYDKRGRKDLADFVNYASKTLHRDATSPDSVQVITFHHSKGLEYDAVYIPLLEKSKPMGEINHDTIVYAPQGKHAANAEDQFKPAWILKNVNKAVNALDETIASGIENIRAEAAYGSLCRLYVGMTRAKHRLVLIHENHTKPTTGKKPKKTEAERTGRFNFLDLTEKKLSTSSTLGSSLDASLDVAGEVSARCLWKASGSSDEWVADRLDEEAHKAAIVDDSKISTFDYSAFAARRLTRIKPSTGNKSLHKGTRSGKHSGKAFGTLVHSLFEGLKWDVEGFLASSRPKIQEGDATLEVAFGRVSKCLSSTSIRELI
jgi:ATP-dependent helicase/nuclease subunit A